MNGDRVDDLLVSAPGAPTGQDGALLLVPGARGGLAAGRATAIRPSGTPLPEFGLRFRTGDFDADGRVDVVEGAPARGLRPGHLGYCPGTRRGLLHCRELGSAAATSSLAAADVNGDGYDDIVQGDSKHGRPTAFVAGSGGEVRLWRGSRQGPRSPPLVITQNSPEVPGDDEPGDEFGGVVAAGDLDADGFADMIVGAPREDGGAGRITILRGNRSGYALAGNTIYDQGSDGVPGAAAPGHAFGSTLTVLQLSRDRHLDLAVAAEGATGADDRIMVVLGGSGVFAPGETRTATVGGISDRVDATQGGRIRLARTGSG
jgi:hypothetical protein